MNKNKDVKNINLKVYSFTRENLDTIKEKIKKSTGFNATSTQIIETAINTISKLEIKSIMIELKSFDKRVDNFLSKNR